MTGKRLVRPECGGKISKGATVIRIELAALPTGNGGADLSLVRPGPDGRPECVLHGAMNKVSPDGIWRCITTTGTSGRRCDAGAYEVSRTVVPDPVCVCNVGAQPCPVHPGNTRTKEEKIAFRIAWDAEVDRATASS